MAAADDGDECHDVKRVVDGWNLDSKHDDKLINIMPRLNKASWKGRKERYI